MFPAICRGRALDIGLLAIVVTVAGCSSPGPGTTPPLAPPPAPTRAPAAEIHSDVPARRPIRPAPMVHRVRMDSAAMELTVTRSLAERPLAMALQKRIKNSELADRVASAIVY